MYIRSGTGLLTRDAMAGAFPPHGSGLAGKHDVAYSCGAVADSHRFPEHPNAITEAQSHTPPKDPLHTEPKPRGVYVRNTRTGSAP